MDQETLLTLAGQIIARLEAHGASAYMVGGCVRDRLLGRPVKDVDIATSALPEDVQALFERTEPTGLAHGTVTVIVGGHPFEVTTFRSESGYSDGRRPDAVRFIADIKEDLARRDFTVNAMALTRDGELVDPFGGERDLADGILRAVGDARERFREDALRMLRAVRFAAEYGLAVEPATWEAIRDMAPRIGVIAIERVRMELERITEGADPARGFQLLAESGLARHFKTPLPLDRMPENPREALGGLAELAEATARWVRLFAVLGIGAAEAAGLMRRLTFSRRKAGEVADVLAFAAGGADFAGRTDGGAERAFKRLVLSRGRRAAERWLAVLAVTPGADPAFRRAAERWLRDMPAAALGELAIGGRDLLAAGLPAGPALGRLLDGLLERVALDGLPNERESLLAAARDMAGEPAGKEARSKAHADAQAALPPASGHGTRRGAEPDAKPDAAPGETGDGR